MVAAFSPPQMNPQPAAMAQPMMPPQPPMGPLAGGMTGMRVDPMAQAGAFMQEPAVMLTLLLLMAQDEEREQGPIYPKWYDKDAYQKPKADDIQAKASEDKSLYSKLVRRMGRDRLIFLLLSVGRFEDGSE